MPDGNLLHTATGPSLDDLAGCIRWVAWRTEPRGEGGKLTKVPYSPAGHRAASTNPADWGTRAEAEAAFRRIGATAHGPGGVGLVLGGVSGGLAIAGVDLDACRDAETGSLSPWAAEVKARLGTYAEVSPSGSGIKLFFTFDPTALPVLRATMGATAGEAKNGRKWGWRGGDHAPAIELYLGGRFFAVTGERLSDSPAGLRGVPTDTLLWLIREAGPFFKARDPAERRAAREVGGGGDALSARLWRAVETNPRLARRWAGDAGGQSDGSRSGIAFALGAELKRSGFSEADTRTLLHRNAYTAVWAAEKGEANGGREMRRIWERAAAEEQPAFAWPEPAMGVLSRSAAPAHDLPLDVFGPFWSRWIARTAEGANAPSDYVALPILAVASALLGNARWVMAWGGWKEPPALWLGSVGNPSSGKSSGASPVTRDVLRKVEMHMARNYPAELERWEEVATVAKTALKAWERAVAQAIKDGEPPPPKPALAQVPPKPVRPRASMTDATVEAVAPLLAGLPKGVLNLRDEMAGWLLNLARYSNGGTDRPFWLEAYNGGPYQVDRQKYPIPIYVPHLTVPAFGTIQPERLSDLLNGADDGLASRFLWAWPEPAHVFAKPGDTGDPEQAAGALRRLADLAMAQSEDGAPVPSYVPLEDGAEQVLVAFARKAQAMEQGAHGLLKSSLGKARGQALRLAGVLEFLWWCADHSRPEPSRISCEAMEAACGFMDAYFVPMAARVLGDASIPVEERNARTLAAWIMETRPELVNVSAIRDTARLSGLRETGAVKGACRFLVEAGWLAEAPRSATAGRPRGDLLVNPHLFGGGR